MVQVSVRKSLHLNLSVTQINLSHLLYIVRIITFADIMHLPAKLILITVCHYGTKQLSFERGHTTQSFVITGSPRLTLNVKNLSV